MKQSAELLAVNDPQSELSYDRVNSLFEKQFPKPFLPPIEFYDNWNSTDERLNLMKDHIVKWLKIDDSPLPVKYAKGLKVPGIYTWQNQQAAIFINIKYRNNPFQVGAILAHECMHHYMRKHSLEALDVKTNELKTDLATICSGLGIPIINGMSHKSHWYLTIILFFIGRIYINEQKRFFGYFKGPEYCSIFNKYLIQRGLDGCNVIGFIHPLARSFLPKDISRKKPKIESESIKVQINKVRQKIALQGVAVIAVVSLILVGYYTEHKTNLHIRSEFQNKKAVIETLVINLKKVQAELEQKKKDMDFYKSIDDNDNYNKLATSYEILRQEGQQTYKKYVLLINDYNNTAAAYKRGGR